MDSPYIRACREVSLRSCSLTSEYAMSPPGGDRCVRAVAADEGFRDLRSAEKRGQRLLVPIHKRSAHGNIRRVAVFTVDQFQIAADLRLQLLGGQHMDHVDVHLPRQQEAQRGLVAALVEQVRDQHDDALARVANAEALHAFVQGRVIARLDPFQVLEHLPQAAAAAHGGSGLP